MSRDEVYRLLKARGLVAYNAAYNPGKPVGGGGCDYAATKSASEWPRAGQPLPATPCSALMVSPNAAKEVKNPSVYVEYGLGFNLACGKSLVQTFTFDDKDKLVAVQDGDESATCL